MSKFEKLATVLFIAIPLIGVDKGWLPHHWAVLLVLIGCYGIDKWVLLKLQKKDEES